MKYRVALKRADQEIVFYKSQKSERWWMEVPYPNSKVRYHRHHLVPCSYHDYEIALRDEMPEALVAGVSEVELEGAVNSE